MAQLDWSVFEGLPGAQTSNWELLCRELVRRNYEQFGVLHSLAQQAGIEFHLELDSPCSLGKASKHWGWQCKWYGIPTGRPIGVTRRRQIEDAIRKSEKYSPSLTDWVLWTRHSLTPKDQEWFNGIQSKFKLRQWNKENVAGLLVGEAEILKATYFGRLVLTDNSFKSMHEEAVAPVRQRWEPKLHVEVEAEQELKAAIAAPNTWPEISEAIQRVKLLAQTTRQDLEGNEQPLANQIIECLEAQSKHLEDILAAFGTDEFVGIRNIASNTVTPSFSRHSVLKLAGELRKLNHVGSLSVSNANWEMGNYFTLVRQIQDVLKQKLFAVVGDAGFGKTHLAADLTQPNSPPMGVLILGKYLSKNGTLDDLTKRISFGGEGIDQLLQAVDAAGARMGRRIPIVIDGLNESENPSDWKELLSTLLVKLEQTEHCVCIVTLRSAVAKQTLPEKTKTYYLHGFEYDAAEALNKYFEFFKIDATDAQLPLEQLQSPLFLRLFCQSINPERKKVVGVERIPGSLTAVFEEYRKGVVSRAAEKLGMAEQDVESSLVNLAMELWEKDARSMEFDRMRELVGDEPRAWQTSLARHLEEEGVLSREPYPRQRLPSVGALQQGNQVSAILYDAFAGFLIADAILQQEGISNFKKWVIEHSEKLEPRSRISHPFSEDVLSAFVGLTPQRHREQFWRLATSPVKEIALAEVTKLEVERIDDGTVLEFEKHCIKQAGPFHSQILTKLYSIRAAAGNPLNAEFLHGLLGKMAVAQRDIWWTDWLRFNSKNISIDLDNLASRWSKAPTRKQSDFLLAKWVLWNLTSNVPSLRDSATRSLYWFGMGSPDKLFEMATESLSFQDPYVSERAFAACYGVLMGRQITINELRKPLQDFLIAIDTCLLGPNATDPSNHWRLRFYVREIVKFAKCFFPEDLASFKFSSQSFGSSSYLTHDKVKEKFNGMLPMDFENDEIGRLFPDRRKYDDTHEGFSDALTEIKGRIRSLGWQHSTFAEIDKRIYDAESRRRNSPEVVDTYSLKYAKIAVQETAGLLSNLDLKVFVRKGVGPYPMVDIDPSFPEEPSPLPLETLSWSDPSTKDNKAWLGSGKVNVPDDLLRIVKLDDEEGPWLAVDGYLKTEDKILDRRVFGFIRGILIPKKQVAEAMSLLGSAEYLGNMYVPECPSDYYTYAGEIPWSENFANSEDYAQDHEEYLGEIGNQFGNGIQVEVLCHRYSWEDYHSSINRAGGYAVPSKTFSQKMKLRAGASCFDQFDEQNRLACIAYSPPEHFNESGNMLYLREDLLLKYMADTGKQLVWVVWGERNLANSNYPRPSWCQAVFQRYQHIWRRVETHERLSQPKRRARKHK